MSGPTRRAVLGTLAGLAAAPALGQDARGRVVVLGGGFGGASAARALHRAGLSVTLVEAETTYTACPFSNEVIAGLQPLAAQRFGYEGLRRAGIAVVHAVATGIDGGARSVALADGSRLPYDRLVLSPGIALRFDAIPGYDEAAAEVMPHAWKAGAQTELLARRLADLPDGGTVVLSVPANPYRCPPGPYERASLIAHVLKTRKPRSKLIVLDAKDTFSKQKLFEAAWKELYPDHLEYVPLAAGGQVTAVDPGTMTVRTDFSEVRAALACIIPPQRAAPIATAAGVADRTGWCPIDPVTFESRLVPGIHVVGDACIGGAMPKSAFSANAQAKVCADAVADLMAGRTPATPKLINTCYSLVAPGYGISVAGVYRPANGVLADVEGAGGTSSLDAPMEARRAEAAYAEAWYRTITADVFG
ncbi:NAD(P)/FAD-dependent oxidoreductase [Methylobacterium isbiliense]|uniref:Sulfide dehydrogenase [flavocytochrome c] flavoprotein chain n=1 Tax=Methylobacterium isbiliense TaxID=315478 RepID=A0ABQ4SDN9_9HYPH|nr:NAD(P)/FAD-dependent oxidoreductase [Methylobacterium isbiliense]MDN3624604.1 FCSD flavin-binding domain-containing protein [Methylobacterium isbiliense]GJE00610.1 Sulfide dehydrogenase [flavocytochrome c] flavoprotein chain [Methylobacterium isbiliense]